MLSCFRFKLQYPDTPFFLVISNEKVLRPSMWFGWVLYDYLAKPDKLFY
jgi:hypothetical protein